MSMMIYNDDLWGRYVKKVEEKFKIKKYPHFDAYFNFTKEKERLHKIVRDTTGRAVAAHPFLPLVKILIKTPRYRYQEEDSSFSLETKIRPISFASHFDGYIYGFYSFGLNEIYQRYIKAHGFYKSVLAYRTDLNGKCNIQFAKEVFDEIKLRGECTAIAIDIKGYFDSIDHDILKEMWCKVLGISSLPIDQYKIYRSLTNYSYVNKSSLLKHFDINLEIKRRKKEYWQTLLDLIPDELAGSSFREKFDLIRKAKLIVTNKPKKDKDGIITRKGIPQGSPLSALLSNIYLIDFDDYLCKYGLKEGFEYRRYCDDIMIICPSEKANGIMEVLTREITDKYKLTIQSKKTEVIDFALNEKGIIRAYKREFDATSQTFILTESTQANYKNLQYLGFEFNGQNIYIRPGSLSRYFRKMKGRIVRSVMMAYSSNSKSNIINKQQIFHRYSHLGKRNFLSYAYNASKKNYTNSKKEVKEGLDSPSIRRQLAAHFRIINQEIVKTSSQRAKQLGRKKVKV